MTRIKDDAYYTPLPIYKWLQDRLQLNHQSWYMCPECFGKG